MEDAHAVKPKPKQSAIQSLEVGRLFISPFLLKEGGGDPHKS
jgi:hypothetical protein